MALLKAGEDSNDAGGQKLSSEEGKQRRLEELQVWNGIHNGKECYWCYIVIKWPICSIG